MSTISQKVANQLGNSGPQITERVIAHFVEKEVARRSEAIIKGLDMLDKLGKEARKHKPDLIAYGDNGSILSQAWSKQKYDERKANAAKLMNLQSALDNAIESNDFSDLLNLVHGNAKTEQPATD